MSDGQVTYEIRADDSSLTGDLQSSENKVEKSASSMGDKFSGAFKGAGLAIGASFLTVGAAAIGIGVSAVSSANDMDKAMNGFLASTGKANSETERYQGVLEDIYANNYGDSFEDIANSMGLITQQMGDLSDEELQKITESAYLLRDTFDMDISESIKGANSMMKQFGVSGEEAYNLIAQGAQQGLNQNGDLAEQVAEYSVYYSQLGVSAEGMFNAMANGVKSGAYQVDYLNDAIKEFGIRSKDGSDTSKQAFEALGFNADEMTKKFAAGGDGAKESFEQVSKALLGMDDKVQQDALGVALFGTKWEDVGVKGISALTGLDGAIDSSKDKLGEIASVKYNSLSEMFGGLKRSVTLLLLPLGEMLIPILTHIIKSILPTLKDALPLITKGFEQMMGPLSEMAGSIMPVLANLFNRLLPIFSTMASMFLPMLVKLLPLIADAFEQIIGPLADLIGSIMPVLINLFTMLIPIFSEIITSILPVLKEVLPLITKGFEQMMGPLSKLIESIVPVLIDLLNSVLPIFSDIATTLPSLIELFGGLIEQLIPLIQQVLPIVIGLFEKLMPPIMQIIQALLPPLIELISALLPIFQVVIDLLMPIIDLFIELLDPIVNLISNALVPLVNALMPIISTLADLLIPQIKDTMAVFKLAFEAIAFVVSNTIQTSIGQLNGWIEFIKGVFTGNWGQAWKGVKEIFSSTISGIGNLFKAPLNAMIDGINSFIKSVGQVKIPDWVPGVGGKGIDIPLIPRLKKGKAFVPNDYYPAFLDYGERVLTQEQNAKFNVMGGIDGMEMALSGGVDNSGVTSNTNINADVSLSNEDINRLCGAIEKIENTIELDGNNLGKLIAPRVDKNLGTTLIRKKRGG